MRKALILAVATAGVVLAQPARPSMVNTPWWDNKLTVNSLNLSEEQTKQLNALQQASVARLMELRGEVLKAETNLNDMFNESEIDQTKAEAAVDQYANARENLTRALSQLSLKMRGVLTAEQWQDLKNRQYGRGGRGPGRLRRGPPPAGSSANKVSPPPYSAK